jgi:hypothetical protein
MIRDAGFVLEAPDGSPLGATVLDDMINASRAAAE